MYFHGLDQGRQFGQELFDLFWRQPVGQTLLGTLQHVLILEKKRGRRQEYELPIRYQPQDRIPSSGSCAKTRDHHRGIQDDSTNHMTSYPMSHSIGYFNR